MISSFPGNEYWLGHFSTSSDPAAACCSLISELQNPCINYDAVHPSRFKFYVRNEWVVVGVDGVGVVVVVVAVVVVVVGGGGGVVVVVVVVVGGGGGGGCGGVDVVS